MYIDGRQTVPTDNFQQTSADDKVTKMAQQNDFRTHLFSDIGRVQIHDVQLNKFQCPVLVEFQVRIAGLRSNAHASQMSKFWKEEKSVVRSKIQVQIIFR